MTRHAALRPNAHKRLMSAAVLVAPRRFEVREVAMPEPGPGEVLVRVAGSGVCASNLPAWEGRPWFSYPMPPGSLGHEAWGTIEAVGDGVHSRLTGEHVATLSTQAYAECVNCPVEDTAVLPEPLTHDAFPGEPLACTMNIIDRSDIRPGQHVAVIGIGFLGALLTRMAATAGAHVIAIARRDSSLDVARRQGAEAAIRWDHRATVVDEVRRLTGAAGCQRVIEAVGKQEAVDLAGELVAERGRLVVAGYHQDGLRQVNMQSWNWRGIDVINAHERDPDRYRSGLQRAIRAVAAGLLDPLALCTHRFPLGQLGAALEMARERPDGFIKALVLM